MDLGPIPGQSPVASFNLDGIDNLIRTKGFLCFHYKHMHNPARENTNSPVDPNIRASHRGFIYYEPRPVYHVPRQYSLEDQLTTQAVFSKGSVLINVSGKYEDNIEGKTSITHIRKNDILIFPSVTDMTQQVFEYNPTGPQKLLHKVKSVDILRDDKFEYICDEDFIVNENGYIEWTKQGRKPEFKNGKGAVLSIVYYYMPIYIVSSMLHSLRVLPDNNQGHAAYPREARYAPQQFVCIPSANMDENDLLDWEAVPSLPDWRDTKNVTGGSY